MRHGPLLPVPSARTMLDGMQVLAAGACRVLQLSGARPTCDEQAMTDRQAVCVERRGATALTGTVSAVWMSWREGSCNTAQAEQHRLVDASTGTAWMKKAATDGWCGATIVTDTV